ncbi:MAG: hypothetical protein K6G10_03985 [Butyrivibrio sp.]|nr:hypothetical protein [Butyrivibrio sp.]
MSEWQKVTDTTIRSYFGTSERFNFLKLLSECEKKVRPLIQKEEGDNKHVHLVPLDNGGLLEVDFHKKYTLVYEYDEKMQKTEVLARTSSERGETATLRSFSSKLKKSKVGVGYPFPETLQNMFRSLRVNELFVFENGLAFLCTKRQGNIVTLKKICGNITGDSDISTLLSDGKEFDVDPSATNEMQALYRLVFDKYTDSAKGRISNMALTKEYVDVLIGGAESKTDKRIDLGPMMFRLKKPFMSQPKIYDSENHVMAPEKMVVLYAWMRNAPVIIDFIHADNKKDHSFDNTRFEEHIEQFFKDGKFDNAYRSICEYVLRLKGELKIEIKTYIKSGDDFYADGFLFSFENGTVFTRRATYADNDITHRIVSLKKSPQRIFTDFCTEKYNSDYFLMKNNKRAVLRKSLPQSEYIVE